MIMTLDELLEFTVQKNASDLHMSAGVSPMIRVDGEMRRINLPELSQETVKSLLYSVMSEKQIRVFEEHREIDFSMTSDNLARFRVNAFYQNRGIGAAFRLIPDELPSLDELNCPQSFHDILSSSQGLVVVTGPTGVGKTTTLAAMIDYLNRSRSAHILTIEDPIEFIYQSDKSLINQREVYRDTLSFQQALRSALREDPDVILVGEMRDLETIRLALTAAETGHLVLATLHTSSAAKTIDRIIDVFPDGEKAHARSMLSESLRAVISQTLLKKHSEGRVAAWEVMIGTPAIKNLIREDKVAQMYSAIQTGQMYGMQTLDQSLKKLVGLGWVSYEEARSKSAYPETF